MVLCLLLATTSAEKPPDRVIRRQRWVVKVRIKATPREDEVDGIKLSGFIPGAVRDVSPSLGSWLIAQGYAEVEMRQAPSENEAKKDSKAERGRYGFGPERAIATDRRKP